MVMATSTTALALGISALALCVVPWLYSKSSDDPDDDLGGPINDPNDPIARSRGEGNSLLSTRFRTICLRGFDLVKVIIPKTCVTADTSRTSANGESVTETPTVTPFHGKNSIEDKRIPIVPLSRKSKDFQSKKRHLARETRKRELSDSLELKELERRYAQLQVRNSIRSAQGRSINSRHLERKIVNSGFLVPASLNLQNFETHRKNSICLNSKVSSAESSELFPIVEEKDLNHRPSDERSSEKMTNRILRFREFDRNARAQNLSVDKWHANANDSSSATDESLGARINETLSSRDEDREMKISPENAAGLHGPATLAESSDNARGFSPGTVNGNSTLRDSSCNAISQQIPIESVAASVSSTSTSEFVLMRKNTSREIEKFFENAPIVRLAILESSKIVEFLNSIEASASSKSKQMYSGVSSKNLSLEKDLANYPEINSSFEGTQGKDVPSHESSDIIECLICKNHHRAEKKSVDRSRRASSFFQYTMTRFRRDVKEDGGPEVRRDLGAMDIKLRESVPIDFEQSTTRPCDYRLMENSCSSSEDQPLDLSIRRIDDPAKLGNCSDISAMNEKSSNIRERNKNRLDIGDTKCSYLENSTNNEKPRSKSAFFRELFGFKRLKESSPKCREGATRSDSIKFYHDPAKFFSTNENITSNCRKVDVEMAKGKECGTSGYQETGDVTKISSDGRFSRKLKKMFSFRCRSYNKTSVPDNTDAYLKTISGEIQRVSREEICGLRKDGESRDWRFVGNEDYIGPCTEL